MTKGFVPVALNVTGTKKKTKNSVAQWCILLGVVLTTLALCAAPYSAPFREWRYGRMSAAELAQSQESRMNDPIYLYYFGRRLNERQQFGAALPVLQRAVGIETESARLRDEWAKAQMGSGHVAEAFGQLNHFVKTHPESADAQRMIGKIYISSDAHGPARIALEKAVRINPQDGEAWSLLAHARLKMGDNGGGKEALEKALTLRPNIAEDHLQLAVLLARKEAAKADIEFACGVALAPENAVARREYSRFLLGQRQNDAAESQARAAIAADKRDALAHLALGRSLTAQNKTAEALPSFVEAARLAPGETQPAELLRRAYRTLGNADQAKAWDIRYAALCQSQERRRTLRNATEAHPYDSPAHQAYAASLAEIGEVNSCARQYAAAYRTTPDNARVLIAAARDLNRFGHAKDALPLIRQALSTTQSNPEAFETLGDILCSLGRTHEAAINYERIRDWRAEKRPLYAKRLQEAAARFAQSDAPAERLLRQAQQADNPAQAKTLLRQALTYEPDNTRCLRALLQREFGAGEKQAAQATAQTLMDISPEDGVAHSLTAILLLSAAEKSPLTAATTRAIETHLKAAENDPSVVPQTLYAYGLLALKENKPKIAVQNFEQALVRDPDSLAAYHRLADARDQMGDTAGAEKARAEFTRRSENPPEKNP